MEHLTQVLVTLFILSLVAERLTNYLKLNRAKLRIKLDGEAEKEREAKIFKLAIWSGIIVALLTKADFFEIISAKPAQSLSDWGNYLQHFATVKGWAKLWKIAQLALGTLITGFFLSQGSRFFHDLLDILVQFKGGKAAVAQVVESKQIFAVPELQTFANTELEHLVFFEDRDDAQDNHL